MMLTTFQKKMTLSILIFLCVAAALTSWYIHAMHSDIQTLTKLKLNEQEMRLKKLADVTSKDGADVVVEKIVVDCSSENRNRFDTQLSKLSQLRGAELFEMEQLFNTCGNFFAERKAVMVARLQREYEVYVDLISMLSLIDPRSASLSYHAESWKELVSLEAKRSELSTKLVQIQGAIIHSLKEKTSLSSDSMQATLVEGQKTKDALVSLSTRISALRQKIPAL